MIYHESEGGFQESFSRESDEHWCSNHSLTESSTNAVTASSHKTGELIMGITVKNKCISTITDF